MDFELGHHVIHRSAASANFNIILSHQISNALVAGRTDIQTAGKTAAAANNDWATGQRERLGQPLSSALLHSRDMIKLVGWCFVLAFDRVAETRARVGDAAQGCTLEGNDGTS